jgi:3-dehydroquinate dehydratase
VLTSDAEVQMSAHTKVHLTPEQAVKIGKEMEKRGSDIAKIVRLIIVGMIC